MGKIEVKNSNFEDLESPCLYIDKSGKLDMSNCVFLKCIGNTNGAGVYLSKCSREIKNICLTDCRGEAGSSLFITSKEKHTIFQVSCLRCSSVRTVGDSVYFDLGKYHVHYFNSTFSKSSQSSVFQYYRTKESETNYLLGDSTEGQSFIELISVGNPVTFQNSALTNNTASQFSIFLNGLSASAFFKKFIFSGNNKNVNRNCFSSLYNIYFEECTYLDKGSFGTNTLPTGVITKETEVFLGKEFGEKWCLEKQPYFCSNNKSNYVQIILEILMLQLYSMDFGINSNEKVEYINSNC